MSALADPAQSLFGKRAGGILLHPTSLPGRYGCGEIGDTALRWVDWLRSAGMRLWQILPLGPTGYADSPYQSFSAFAGNPLLIDLERLQRTGLLAEGDLDSTPAWGGRIDYGELIPWKMGLLRTAANRFLGDADPARKQQFEAFLDREGHWLHDFALFMALKREHGGAAWTTWNADLAARKENTLSRAFVEHQDEISRQLVLQFLFFEQWQELHEYAAAHGITLIGDMPIFLAHDSADVWAHPDLFQLDADGHPLVVAGVPPDYFSATGQRWGNPLYRWDRMEEYGYAWWKARMGVLLSMVDVVRLDHFRGFEAYWEIPAEMDTAEQGRWVPGPGDALLDVLRQELGWLPILAEDLGVITPEVVALRKRFGLPGMRVLQFGFEGGPESPHLPHNYEPVCAVYSGTHDNDTSLGWFGSVDEEVQSFTRQYLGCGEGQEVEAMLRAIWSSCASWAITPMQDILGLDGRARMNTPGVTQGNWAWRLQEGQPTEGLSAHLYELNWTYGRSED